MEIDVKNLESFIERKESRVPRVTTTEVGYWLLHCPRLKFDANQQVKDTALGTLMMLYLVDMRIEDGKILFTRTPKGELLAQQLEAYLTLIRD